MAAMSLHVFRVTCADSVYVVATDAVNALEVVDVRALVDGLTTDDVVRIQDESLLAITFDDPWLPMPEGATLAGKVVTAMAGAWAGWVNDTGWLADSDDVTVKEAA